MQLNTFSKKNFEKRPKNVKKSKSFEIALSNYTMRKKSKRAYK